MPVTRSGKSTEPFVELNCAFIHPESNLHDHFTIQLSTAEYQQKLDVCNIRRRFTEAIGSKLDLVVRCNDLLFYKVTDSKRARTITVGTTPSLTDVGERIPNYLSFKCELGDVNDLSDEALHLAVGIKEGALLRPKRDDNETQDSIGPLPENQRFIMARTTKVKSPSLGSKSSEYAKTQAVAHQAIYDGLHSPDSITTIAPPLRIFHHVFQQFTRDANEFTTSLSPAFLERVLRLMDHAATIKSGLEIQWNAETRKLLASILEVHVTAEANVDMSSADATVMVELDDNIRFPLLAGEFKRAFGEAGYDMTIQAGNSMRRLFQDSTRETIVNVCCCPVFMIAIGGPWLTILGGVFTDRFIVQRLTDTLWLAPSTTHDDRRVYRVARVLYALSKALMTLRDFYTNLMASAPPFDPLKPHPRNFPYPNSYVQNGELFMFRYLKALEDDSRCVTYLAEIEGGESSGERVVVKFVERYGEEVHRFLAKSERAPQLRYYGALPDKPIHTTQSPAPSSSAPDSLMSLAPATNMQMVVMDFVETGSETLSSDAVDQLRMILDDLSEEGCVFGDLREPNIVIDSGGKVKLIDFDWAGRYDKSDTTSELVENGAPQDSRFTYYPLSLSSRLFEDARPLHPIRPSHDIAMLEKLRS